MRGYSVTKAIYQEKVSTFKKGSALIQKSPSSPSILLPPGSNSPRAIHPPKLSPRRPYPLP